jgi:hypothetical protein
LSARAILVAAVVLLIAAPVARADGDPASDYLLAQSSFIPPDAGVPPAYAKQLNEVIASAKAGGYPIRVALIASRYDLGSVGVLYKQPQRYARFLGQELTFIYRGPLLVVMPNGLGISRDGKAVPASQAVVDRLPAPGQSGAALASTATHAVTKLAAEAGVVVAVPELKGDASTPNQNHDRLLIAAIVVIAIAGFVAFRLLRRRRVSA